MLKLSKLTILLIGFILSTASFAEQKTLRVAAWLPPSHPQNSIVWPTWAKWVEEATQGRVVVEMEYGMGHPKTMFDLVEDGVADVSFSYHGYVPGRFKLTQIVEQPLLGVGAEAASVAHWRIHQKYLKGAGEHEGLEVIALFTHGPGQIQMRKPINSIAELKGKKIRLGGGVQGELGHRMGVTSVGAPAPKVYEMMQQGVIDGAFIPLAEQKFLRLKEVATNIIALPTGMYLGSFSIFMNPEFLEEIAPKDREAILSVSGEKLSALAGKTWDEADSAGLTAAKDADVNITFINEEDSIYLEFLELTKGMEEEFHKTVSSRGVNTRAALEELKDIARNYH